MIGKIETQMVSFTAWKLASVQRIVHLTMTMTTKNTIPSKTLVHLDSPIASEEEYVLKIVEEMMMMMMMMERKTKCLRIVLREQPFVSRQDFAPQSVQRKKKSKICPMVISQTTFLATFSKRLDNVTIQNRINWLSSAVSYHNLSVPIFGKKKEKFNRNSFQNLFVATFKSAATTCGEWRQCCGLAYKNEVLN